MTGAAVRHDISLLTPDDVDRFRAGTHDRLYEILGAHPLRDGELAGTLFGVWAPNAEQVSVMGDFNGWAAETHPLVQRGESGIWEGFVPGVGHGAPYKYHICSQNGGYRIDKADPFARCAELPPQTASVVWDQSHTWTDQEWQANRRYLNNLEKPWSVYEVHLGSWMRVPEEGERWLTYRELAPRLAAHVRNLGFTHVELLPVMEHPFYGSWGYQVTGYFAPTSRHGTPDQFQYLVDYLHRQGIGVILDWVPAHFPADGHGLGYFDGSHLYEHEDYRRGFHPDWNTKIFNYERGEVQSFLLSSAAFWIEQTHADGLRVDAVTSMLRLDYSRKAGEWLPNEHGGPENLAAIAFVRQLNDLVSREYPGVQVIAEESSAWPQVTRPAAQGGLGFAMKWDMGWMNDTLRYMALDPIYRKHHHHLLTFRAMYANTESFLLPLSHDEVVHGKGSLLGKMPGDTWQRFANLRLLLGWMFATPGKKLLFMGSEFGPWREWDHESSLDWHLVNEEMHAGLLLWLGDLNRLYTRERAMHLLDFDPGGFEWIDCDDADAGVLSLLRKGRDPEDTVLAVCHFTPLVREGYRIGAPHGGRWRLLLHSDGRQYGGTGEGQHRWVEAEPVAHHGRAHSLALRLMPLAIAFYKPER